MIWIQPLHLMRNKRGSFYPPLFPKRGSKRLKKGVILPPHIIYIIKINILEEVKKKSKINWGGCGGYYIIPVAIGKNKTLGDSSKKVLSYLINLWVCCDKVHPSTEAIMEATFSSEKSVKRAKVQLVDLGLISITHIGKGRGDANEYKVNEDEINKFLGVELFTTSQPVQDETKTKSGRKKLN